MKTDNRCIYVLHESGAPSHFRALKYFVDNNRGYDLKFYEFDIIKKYIKGLIKKDKSLRNRAFRNLKFFLKKFLSLNDSIIIIGLAPYDKKIILANYLKRKNRIIYYSSWPYWDQSFYPKKNLFNNSILNIWSNFLNNIDLVTVLKEGETNIREKYKINKSIIIPHCLDNNIYYPINRDLKNRKFNIIFMGRLTKEKGIDNIINLCNDRDLSNLFTLYILGKGEYRKKEIETMNDNGNCIYFGYINDEYKIANILQQCDILIQPSIKNSKWEELFGMAIIEGMACGVVPIASDNIGPKNIIKDHFNGLLIRQDSYIDLKNSILELISNNKLYEKLRKNTIKSSEEYYIELNSVKWRKIIE